MTNTITIRQVASQSDWQAFLEFPWVIYKDDPNWVPPLFSMRKEMFDREKHPSWEYMEGDSFGAWRGDQLVGTVTAFVNHRHNEIQNEHVAWFGTFEVIEDKEVANALLDRACEWATERGYDAIRGPFSFTSHEECGLLIENFDPPILLMTYNPRYYQTFIEDYGFEKSIDVKSVYCDWDIVRKHKIEERLDRLVKRASRRSDIVIRGVDRKQLKAEFQLFKDIYNDAWDENFGFVPMTQRELDNMIESLGQFFDPDLAFFAEVDGEPAGFALSIPNFNEVLARVKPHPHKPEIISMAQAGWYWKVQRVIRGARLPLLGVKEEHRNKGVDLALYLATVRAMRNYNHLDSGWILETNSLLKIVDSLGMELYKTYRWYIKPLKADT